MRAAISTRQFLTIGSVAVAFASVTAAVTPSFAYAERSFSWLLTDTTAARRPKDKVKSFASAQQDNARVLEARLEKRFELRKTFADHGVDLHTSHVFFRIFKRERMLEVWAKDPKLTQYVLVKSYPICALAGQLGPKRAQGDGQTPEGVYFIDGFNPVSGYHLSLHIDYPNRADQILAPGNNLGGNIFIHGGCKTEGCLAVTDDAIKELYWIAVESHNAGQQKIPVHIFPARLTDDALFQLTQVFDDRPDNKRFWSNLKTTYDFFEANKTMPDIEIDKKGRYKIVAPAAAVANNN